MGFDTISFAQAGASVTAIDLSAKCLELTRKHLSWYGLEADLNVGNAEDLNLPAEHFDIVTARGLFMFTPRPTEILMEPGDACITVYQMPHSGTRNENGTESRKGIIFRIRNKKRQPDKLVSGVTDHPDRGQMGEWLEYEEGNDPWERSKYAMCHMWHEWEGMQKVVAEEQAKEAGSPG